MSEQKLLIYILLSIDNQVNFYNVNYSLANSCFQHHNQNAQ
jgi:hypothetical protein